MANKAVALIPARSGSKSVVDKNVRQIAGKPLLVWSIQHALDCPDIDRVIVSTDDESYAEIAKQYGAEAPFLRPQKYAQDDSTDLEVFTHALKWLEDNEDYRPEVVVHLRPTCPYRNIDDISAMIKMLKEHPEADSVRSVVVAEDTPYKMWRHGNDGYLTPLLNDVKGDAYNMPRQILPKVYLQNAAIDVVRTSVILKTQSMTGHKILGYVQKHNYDIDSERHFMLTNEALSLRYALDPYASKKVFCIDIDGVVASIVPDLDYKKSKAVTKSIEVINRLYDNGHRIIMFTARGTMTNINWRKITEEQFACWGLKYHELVFGKPAADYYIDDRMLSMVTFFAID